MPSSGSTTSCIASSMSASSSLSGAAVSLIRYLLCAGPRQCVFESHPAEQRAFHPGRILRDAGERDAVAQHLLVTLHGASRGHHLGERGDGLDRLADALADHLLGEDRGGGLADRAALPVVGHVGDVLAVVGQRHPQRHLVAADRVDVVHLGGERLSQPPVLRMLVVVEDHILIHLLETHGQAPPTHGGAPLRPASPRLRSPTKKSSARRTPATNRSTSSGVLYTAN